jgi:hypothetical protein
MPLSPQAGRVFPLWHYCSSKWLRIPEIWRRLKELVWLLQEPPVADEAGGSPVLGVAAAELELVVSAGAR